MKRSTITRRSAALLLGLLALIILVAPVSAGRRWCAKDPIVNLNGIPVQMWVAIPEEYVPYVNGPIDMTISVPEEVEREIVFLDSGFNGYGEVVRFKDAGSWGLLSGWRPAKVAADGSFDVEVSTKVPVNKNLLFNLLFKTSIPLQLTIVFADGSTDTVEMTNNGARIAFRVTPQQ